MAITAAGELVLSVPRRHGWRISVRGEVAPSGDSGDDHLLKLSPTAEVVWAVRRIGTGANAVQIASDGDNSVALAHSGDESPPSRTEPSCGRTARVPRWVSALAISPSGDVWAGGGDELAGLDCELDRGQGLLFTRVEGALCGASLAARPFVAPEETDAISIATMFITDSELHLIGHLRGAAVDIGAGPTDTEGGDRVFFARYSLND